MEPLNSDLLTQALNFHGQQLQKVWEAERGEQDLAKYNIKDLNFQVYGQRQKYLSFQDRGKRLKLQQFIVKKANQLFTQEVLHKNNSADEHVITEDMHAIMPPFETYLSVDKQSRLKYFFENVHIGDLILGTIVSKTQSGMMLKVLCTVAPGSSSVHYVADINVKAFCPVANIIPAVDRKGVTRSYMMNDSVCCEVLEVIPDTDKMVCGMKGTTRQPNDPEHRPALGLIGADDFPLVYKKALDHKGESYDAVLEKSVGFNNPNNISYLSEVMGITSNLTFMNGLAGRFPEQEYSHELRQVQASKWAYRNVADGIDHFKAGRHTEAFQCLNKALNIDPKNVEGLVARGALYANSGNFQKAIEDFETALKLNPSHANARKYMGETLVALGRSYEEENKIEEARKAYQSCLSIIPFHEEAQNSLEFLKNKAQTAKNLIEPGDLLLPNLNAAAAAAAASSKPTDVNDALKQLLKNEDEEKKDKKKKKKSKKRKNRRRSSSSSSSSSSGSNESSSSSSSSSTDSSSSSGDSDFKKRKKHRSRSHRREKQSSLSPLSKRMALMDPTHDTPASYQFNKPAASSSFDFAFEQPPEPPKADHDDYELKVRSFLEQTKGDSDYEEKVRKFLEESARWKKDKKGDDSKKKKKKKDKKAKKDSKKKRKEKKLKRKHFDLSELEDLENKKLRDALKKELGIKEKRSKRHSLNSDDEDYLLQKAGYSKRFLDSLPDLEELESKLNAYYALEKESKRSELSESPKRSLILDSPSPTREQKARQAVAEATASATASGAPTKWKMQIVNAPAGGGSRFKKKPDRDEWPDDQLLDKRLSKNNDLMEESNKKMPPLPPPSGEKNISVRKAMALKEVPPPMKKEPELPKKQPKPPPPAPQKPLIPPGQVVLDKFGNFRLLSPPQRIQSDRGDDLPPLPPGAPPKDSYGGSRKPPEPPGRPRSGSRSSRRSRSRSRGRKYSRSRSSSMSRSRSRSYRSRSRSYYSRSRSRSGSYYSRSRSRSRSYSGERRRYRRGGFRGGRYGDRGTYYKPRLPPRGGSNYRGRGNYYRDSRDGYRDYRGRGRPYNTRGRRPRGRFNRGGYRDYRDRRYDRSRSRDRSRSLSGSRDRESVDTMRKVNAEKEKINKYLDNDGEPIRHEGPLSEGEDRDDYTSENNTPLYYYQNLNNDRPAPQKPLIPPGQVVLDKFGNFRLLSPPQRIQSDRGDDLPPLPPGAPPKDSYGGSRKPPEPPGRPRSGSRSSRRSRSRSRGRKYSRSRSSSMSRSRSRSYRSRSRSYYSRSRSRSGSYYSRSRSRSRSYSGERRRYRRGGFRGGRYGDRGTYYKPRLPPRGGSNYRGRGNYYRDSRDGYRDYRGRGRPYNTRGRRPRGRFNRGGYRDYRDRRYDRSRSRDRSRSLSGSRDRESVDTMRKVNAEKEKINKYLDNDGEPIRHEGPLSEGEDRDDYTSENKYVDREAYDGKWGDKGSVGGDDKHKGIPNETNLEEMDKFLDKAKKDKKEEMLERNKEFLKDKS